MHGDLVDVPKSVPEDLAERADEDDDDEGLVCRRPQSAQRALSFPNLLVTQYLSYLLLLQANICLLSSSSCFLRLCCVEITLRRALTVGQATCFVFAGPGLLEHSRLLWNLS